jgi:hypothetical protein
MEIAGATADMGMIMSVQQAHDLARDFFSLHQQSHLWAQGEVPTKS